MQKEGSNGNLGSQIFSRQKNLERSSCKVNGYYIFVHVIFESSLASFKMVTARARTRSRFLFRSNYSSHLLTHIPFSLFFTMFKFSVYHIFFFKTCSTSNIFLPIIGNISRNTTQKSKLEYFTFILLLAVTGWVQLQNLIFFCLYCTSELLQGAGFFYSNAAESFQFLANFQTAKNLEERLPIFIAPKTHLESRAF